MATGKTEMPSWAQLTAAGAFALALAYFAIGDTWERIRTAPDEIQALANDLTKYATNQEYLQRDVAEARRSAEKAAQSAEDIKQILMQRQPPYPPPPAYPSQRYPPPQSYPPPQQYPPQGYGAPSAVPTP